MFRYCILGFGRIAKKHLNAIDNNTDSSLVATIDTQPKFEQPLSIPNFKSIDEFQKADIDCDLIVVCSPNGLHFEHVMRALEAGFHVLVEKPLTLSLEQSEELIQKSKLTNRRIFSVMQLRFSPVVQWLKSNIKELGKINLITINCFWNRNKDYYTKHSWHGTNQLDGGVLFTQFSHFIDILMYLFPNSIEYRNSRSVNFSHSDCTEFPDTGVIDFGITESGIGSMVYTTTATNKTFESSITVISENATIKIGDQYLNKLLYFESNSITPPSFLTQDIINFHSNVYEEVQDALINRRKSILDARHALPLVDFIEKATFELVN